MSFSPHDQHTLLIITSTMSAFSIVGSAFIIFCYYLFKDLRNLAFELVFWLSVSDLCEAMANLIGDPSEDEGKNFLCQFQAVLHGYFDLTSLFWSIAIARTLQMGFLQGKKLNHKSEIKRFHLLIWAIAAVLVVLPLATDSYGEAGGWCWLTSKTDMDQAWRFIQFYIPCWICILYNAYVFILVYRRIGEQENLDLKARKTRDRLKFYPLVLVITWIWGTINRLYQLGAPPVLWLTCLHRAFSAFHGCLNALVYGNTEDVRTRLKARLGLAPAPSTTEDESKSSIHLEDGQQGVVIEPLQEDQKLDESESGADVSGPKVAESEIPEIGKRDSNASDR